MKKDQIQWVAPPPRQSNSGKRTKKPTVILPTLYDPIPELTLSELSKAELVKEVYRLHCWIKQCAIECGLCMNAHGMVYFSADVGAILYKKLQFDALGPLHKKVGI